jgi:capsule biosynthesis phosphatase
MKTYVFDIDGTICTKTKNGSYTDVEPFETRIRMINRLFDQNNQIIINTARGMGRSENNPNVAKSLFYDLTIKQLSNWGVKYHRIFMGKPAGDLYVDDKGIKDEDFFDSRD